MDTEIQNFYSGKTVFVTGGTGFLGKVFIEKLLRATDVKRIYMLIRPKRGKDIAVRIHEIFSDPLFEKLLKEKSPPAQERITLISGDCTQPQLGLSAADRALLVSQVDVVVHSAATVRFNEPMSKALAINVRATLDLIALAKQMRRLQAFVHVSSAFANCFASTIEERSYADALVIGAEKVCRMADLVGPEILDRLSDQLLKGFPNTYCYTKALAEEAVFTEGKELPICIFRPGIIIPTNKEPMPGWIDNLYGPTAILYGVATGVLRIMYMRIKSRAHIVPVDACANLMLVSGWKQSQRDAATEPPVYNLVPDEQNSIRWEGYQQVVSERGYLMPISKMIWYPFMIPTSSKLFYHVLCFIYHILPGYLFDTILLLMGRKRFLVETYRKVHKQNALLQYFTDHDWTITMDKTKALWQSLSDADRDLFNFDLLTIDWKEYFFTCLHGMRRFIAKEEPATIPKAQQLLGRLLILHRAMQILVYGGGTILIYLTALRLFQRF